MQEQIFCQVGDKLLWKIDNKPRCYTFGIIKSMSGNFVEVQWDDMPRQVTHAAYEFICFDKAKKQLFNLSR